MADLMYRLAVEVENYGCGRCRCVDVSIPIPMPTSAPLTVGMLMRKDPGGTATRGGRSISGIHWCWRSTARYAALTSERVTIRALGAGRTGRSNAPVKL
jgi:hypothetical protein